MHFSFKPSLFIPMLALLAAMPACGDDGNGGSGGSGASNNTGGSGGDGTGGMGTGGMGTGGMGTGGMGTGGMGTGGMGTGGGGALCGNGVLDAGEQCDDGADACGDGCLQCKVQSGFTCTGAPSKCMFVPPDTADFNARCTNDMVNSPVPLPADVIWADNVVEVSSEYSPTDYSGKQALGVPDVYPTYGDEPKAWATLETDKAGEYITVGFTNPVVASVVWIFETFNPDAVSKITVTAADGDHVAYTAPANNAIGGCSYVLTAPTTTCSPISKIRVDLASDKVSNYNEIDAIGVTP